MTTVFWILVIVAIIWFVARRKESAGTEVERSNAVGPTSETTSRKQTRSAREQPKRRPVAEDESFFTADLTLDEDSPSRGYRVPPRPRDGTVRPQTDTGRQQVTRVPSAWGDIELEFNTYYGRGTDYFLKDAKANEHRTHPPTKHVEFKAYRTTHRDMNREQEKWFYYWRDEVRNERYPDTDLSYVYLYIYETLNLVGVQSPQEAFGQVLAVYENYRERLPHLERYLPDWLLDLNAYYDLGHEPLDLIARLMRKGARFLHTDYVIAAWARTRDYDLLTPEVVRRLSNFNARESRFYKEYDDTELIDQTFKLTFETVDKYFLDTTGKGVFEIRNPKAKHVVKRLAFTGAIFASEDREVTVAELPDFQRLKKPQELLENAFKYAENILRKQTGFTGARRVNGLPDDLLKWLDVALKADRATPALKVVPRREIRIDTGRAWSLAEESREVRERLIGDDFRSEAVAEEARSAAPSAPAFVPVSKEVLEDQQDALHAVLSPAHLAALDIVHRGGGWDELEGLASDNYTMGSMLVDEINEHALVVIGDNLVDAHEDPPVIHGEHEPLVEALTRERSVP